MNIHEHQVKDVLREFGAPIGQGVAVFSVDEAKAAIDRLPGPLYVVKAQIHAVGRGKGKFKEKEASISSQRICKMSATLSRWESAETSPRTTTGNFPAFWTSCRCWG